jgi:hypothetical protein
MLSSPACDQASKGSCHTSKPVLPITRFSPGLRETGSARPPAHAVVWGRLRPVRAFTTKRGYVPWAGQLRILAVLVLVVIVLVRARVFRARSLNTDPVRARASAWSCLPMGCCSPRAPVCTSGGTGVWASV